MVGRGGRISRVLRDFPNTAKLVLSTRFIVNNAIRLANKAQTSYEPILLLRFSPYWVWGYFGF